MVRYLTIFAAYSCIFFFGFACSNSHEKKIIANNFAKEFNTNKSDYQYIKDFILLNTDSINTIRIKDDTLCEVSKRHLKNALGDYMRINCNQIDNPEQQDDLNRIRVFMIKNSISYIGGNNDKVEISYIYSGIPCFDLIWESDSIENETGIVIQDSNQNKVLWKYYIDSNWYIKGIPCFN